MGTHERIDRSLSTEYCLTFIRGVSDNEALTRMGGYPDTYAVRNLEGARERMRDFDAGYPRMAVAVPLDGWTLVVEPNGYEGTKVELLLAVSAGSAAVLVARQNMGAFHYFGYAVDGRLVERFPPERPWEAIGTELREDLHAVGLLPPDVEYEYDPIPPTLHLAERLTGTMVPADVATSAFLSGQFEPWFVAGTAPGYQLLQDPFGLRTAALGAEPATQRAVAVAEVRRIAGNLGLTGTPGLDGYLEKAGEGPALVARDSELGRHVRAWLDERSRAWRFNRLRDADRLSTEELDYRAALGWFLPAVRGVGDPDPRVAILAALRPVGMGPAIFGDRATVFDDLLRRFSRRS